MRYRLEIEFDEFGWEALNEEARRQAVGVEELLAHAAMYYLAHADKGRAGRVLSEEPRGSQAG